MSHGTTSRAARRWLTIAGAAVIATALAALASVAPASAAPARQDSAARPIIFVHGFNVFSATVLNKGTNCAVTWGSAASAIRKSGWTGPFATFGYDGADTHCTFSHAGNGNTSLAHIGWELAWDIYNNYSRHNQPVDVIAHSMGGLIIRSALDAVHKKMPGYPAYLYVEDVATLATPHDGTPVAKACAGVLVQCKEMSPGSTFLTQLGRNPQSAMGTDWTLLASNADKVVPVSSAADKGHTTWGHKVFFQSWENISHGGMRTVVSGTHAMVYENYWDHYKTHYTPRGASPVIAAKNACYWWWRW